MKIKLAKPGLRLSMVPSDLFLSHDLTEEQAHSYLRSIGVRDAAAADRHLRAMAEDPAVRLALGRLARPLMDALARAPDPDAAVVGLARYLGARTARVLFLDYLQADPAPLAVLIQILGTSPFLSEILVRNPEYLHWLVPRFQTDRPGSIEPDHGPDGLGLEGSAVSRLNALKRLKRREILRIATRDMFGHDSLRDTTQQLSTLADLIVDRVLAHICRDRLSAEGFRDLPGRFAVIGMGKLGGQELNYSSDIDLIYVYEPENEDDARAHGLFQRLARRLTVALTEHTDEGYLYRVDLRLRPMGRSGNIANSLKQLRHYYHSWGVTFERFALIKARPIAGDLQLGRRFVEDVQPFVYREYLDHAALEEMYQHKASVDRAIERGRRDRNIKLGRGGIREVELFTQVLQLTYGAKYPELKQCNTLAALEALRDTRLVPGEICETLVQGYELLRTIEHRLQMVEDSQTHVLPESPEQLAVAARRLRFKSVDALEVELEAWRRRVHEAYSGLFERRRGTMGFEARQFFRLLGGDLPEEEALVHLSDSGFRDPGDILPVIRALGEHATLASAPTTARNVLANLLAEWAPSLANVARPELVLTRFEQLAAQTGGATRLARSLLENPVLSEALFDVLDSGALLAQRLIRHPELLDTLVRPPEAVAALRRSFDATLTRMGRLDHPDRMNALRRFKQIEEFKVIVRWLGNRPSGSFKSQVSTLNSEAESKNLETSDPRLETSAGLLDRLYEELSVLADYCVARAAEWCAPTALDDPLAAWAIVALGKLGGAELDVHSDLDLVFVYQDERDPSDSSARWQAFVEDTQSLLGQPTSEGIAYRVDTRLRPEGTKGPLAIPVAALVRYFSERAEPWERLAWTRAQILVGSPGLSAMLLEAVAAFVYGPWLPDLPTYMHAIRQRMERQLAKESYARLNLKVGRGGLADIDFLLQLVQIREGAVHPEFRQLGTRQLLAALPSTRYITASEVDDLREAHRMLRTLETLIRLEMDSAVSWIEPDPARLDPVARRMGCAEPAGQRLLARYRDLTDRVRTIYSAVLVRLGGR